MPQEPKFFKNSTTVAIHGLVQNLRAEGQRIYSLSAGEPMVDTAHFYKTAVDEAIEAGHTFYPPAAGIPELRRASSEWMNREFQTDYQPKHALVTGGGKFAIYLTLLSLLKTGDEVLIPSPHYLSYPQMIELVGAKPIPVPASSEKGWRLTPEDLEPFCTSKTRLLVLNSGTNPTGLVYSKEEIEAFLDFAERHDLWVLSDEVYSGLVYDDFSYFSCATPPRTRDRVAVIQSASKTFGMTGWRLGFLFGSEALIQSCEALQSQILTSTSIVSQWAGLSAFQQAEKITPMIKKTMQERRDIFYNALEKGLGVSLSRPASAFYAFLPLSLFGSSGLSDVEWCQKILKEAHVATVPGSPFGRADYVRMSFGEKPEELLEAVDVLCKWVKKN
ncbi:MAG: pyridoxal phosphate-dependent aminotransferase [Candidatus Gracilibacteria bacterium]